MSSTSSTPKPSNPLNLKPVTTGSKINSTYPGSHLHPARVMGPPLHTGRTAVKLVIPQYTPTTEVDLASPPPIENPDLVLRFGPEVTNPPAATVGVGNGRARIHSTSSISSTQSSGPPAMPFRKPPQALLPSPSTSSVNSFVLLERQTSSASSRSRSANEVELTPSTPRETDCGPQASISLEGKPTKAKKSGISGLLPSKTKKKGDGPPVDGEALPRTSMDSVTTCDAASVKSVKSSQTPLISLSKLARSSTVPTPEEEQVLDAIKKAKEKYQRESALRQDEHQKELRELEASVQKLREQKEEQQRKEEEEAQERERLRKAQKKEAKKNAKEIQTQIFRSKGEKRDYKELGRKMGDDAKALAKGDGERLKSEKAAYKERKKAGKKLLSDVREGKDADFDGFLEKYGHIPEMREWAERVHGFASALQEYDRQIQGLKDNLRVFKAPGLIKARIDKFLSSKKAALLRQSDQDAHADGDMPITPTQSSSLYPPPTHPGTPMNHCIPGCPKGRPLSTIPDVDASLEAEFNADFREELAVLEKHEEDITLQLSDRLREISEFMGDVEDAFIPPWFRNDEPSTSSESEPVVSATAATGGQGNLLVEGTVDSSQGCVIHHVERLKALSKLERPSEDYEAMHKDMDSNPFLTSLHDTFCTNQSCHLPPPPSTDSQSLKKTPSLRRKPKLQYRVTNPDPPSEAES
ncbi:hypothetical protein ONZ45_g12376 [Pleurotus djamor]|nr:hypothetical protein ONZ45_g12376 [Pleurotus djamor]